MKKLALAATVIAVLAGLTACQKDVTMWSSCRPATDGNPTGTDGRYVLACRNGTWEPVMTVREWLAIRGGERVRIAPLPTRPTPTTTTSTTSTTTSTTSTTTTSTTTTTAPSTIQTFDLGDRSLDTAVDPWGYWSVTRSVTLSNGREAGVQVMLVDPIFSSAADGGYRWAVMVAGQSTETFGEASCAYSILSYRGRATLGGTTYRMDFDGDTLGVASDLDGPWDFQNGDLPVAYMESITVDWSNRSCVPTP